MASIYRLFAASRRKGLPWLFGAILLIGAFWGVTLWRAHSLDAYLREMLLYQAKALARNVDPALVQRLTFTPTDKGNPAYERLRAQLTAYGRLIPNWGIYTMALRDGQIVFGPENYPEGDPMASPPGTVYQEPAPEDFAIFQTGQPCTIGPVSDEYGTFVSALAPVWDPDTGQVLMVVGIDILAEDWLAEIHRVYRQALWAALPILFLVGWYGAVHLWRRGAARRPWLSLPHLEAIFTAMLGLYLTGLAAALGNESERLSHQRFFQELAQTRLAGVRAAVESAQRDLASIARYFESSEDVSREEFARFAGELARNTAVEAYYWAPIVPAQQRAALEETARREGLQNYAIWERNAALEPVPASPREVYYPIYYVEPPPIGVSALGFDLGSEPPHRAALEEALRTGFPTATEPLTLLSEPRERLGVILLQPTTSGGEQSDGLVGGVLRLQGLLEGALRPYYEVPPLLGLGLLSLEPQTTRVLAVYPQEHLAEHPTLTTGMQLRGPLYAVQPLFIGGQTFLLNARPSSAFEALQPRRAPWLIALAGLSLTAMLATMVSLFHRREQALQEQVRERTIALETARDRAQGYLDVAGVILLHIDREGRVTLINRRGLEILGCRAEEVIGKVWVDHFVPPEEREETRQVLQALLEGRANAAAFEYHENAILTAQGERRLIAWHNILIRDREGRFQGILSSGEDITERRRAEEALRESEERHRRVSQMISDYAYAYRVEPDGTLNVEWVIGGFERTTGFTLEESEARGGWSALIYPEDMPIALERAKRLFSGQADVSEFRIVRKDGQIRWLRDYGQPEWDAREGRVVRIYGAAEDITERKRAEEERLEMERRLLQAQRLESLGVLAGGVAHDFNNLLMAIMGNLELALLDLPRTSGIRANLLEASQAARLAADLTRQLLAYAGKGRFTLSRVNLNAVVQENAQLFRTAIPRAVTLTLNLAPDLPTIEADRSQIQQVMMNLLTNAAEAIGEKPGAITLTTGVIEADAALLAQSRLPEVPPPGRYVFLEVTDTGCGMDEATIERVFEPFFSTKFTGRGLGMSAVAGVVRGHGGAIFIKSAIGQGTTVRVLFPAAQGEPRPQEPREAERQTASATGGEKTSRGLALVVDDEPSVRQVAELMFRRMGFQAFSAASGPEALEFLRRHGPVRIVLLDLSMPGMDGLTALAEMRRLVPDIRVILSSGYNEQAISQRLTGQGEVEFIQKPFDFAALREAVERALGQAQGGAEA